MIIVMDTTSTSRSYQRMESSSFKRDGVPAEIHGSCAQTCISSVTKDLPDFGGSALYPSRQLVEGLPDILVSERPHGKFEILSQHSGSHSNSHSHSHSHSNSNSRSGGFDSNLRRMITNESCDRNALPPRRPLRTADSVDGDINKSLGNVPSIYSHSYPPPSKTQVHPSLVVDERQSGAAAAEQLPELPVRKESDCSLPNAFPSVGAPSTASVGEDSRSHSHSQPSCSLPSIAALDRERDDWSMNSSIYAHLHLVREQHQRKLHQQGQRQRQAESKFNIPRWSSQGALGKAEEGRGCNKNADIPLRPPARDDLSYASMDMDETSIRMDTPQQQQQQDTPPSRPHRRMTQDSWNQMVFSFSNDSIATFNSNSDASTYKQGGSFAVGLPFSAASSLAPSLDPLREECHHPTTTTTAAAAAAARYNGSSKKLSASSVGLDEERTASTTSEGTSYHLDSAGFVKEVTTPLRSNVQKQKQQRQPSLQLIGDDAPSSILDDSNGARIEIQPGVYATLRGSEETFQALKHGFVSVGSCILCNTSLICIADAEYIYCPDCKVISPLEGEKGGKGGVGLGYPLDALPGNAY